MDLCGDLCLQAQLGTHRTPLVDVTLWTGASVDLADDSLLQSGQALVLEHQRVDSGSQCSPSMS